MEHIAQLANSPGFAKIMEENGKPVALVVANRLLED